MLARAADEAKPPSAAEISHAVAQLGADRHSERKAATQFLRQAGAPAVDALEAAAKSDDPEVAERAHGILYDARYGIFPDTPPDVAVLLRRYRNGDKRSRIATLRSLERVGAAACQSLALLRRGETDPDLLKEISRRLLGATRVMLSKIPPEQWPSLPARYRQAGDPAVKKEIAKWMASNFTDANTRKLIQTGHLKTAIEIHTLAALHGHWQNTLAALWLTTGKINGAEQLAARAKAAGIEMKPEIMSRLYWAAGDLAKAVEFAKEAKAAPWLEGIFIDQGNWEGLVKLTSEYDAANVKAYTLGRMALYNRLAGNDKGYAATIERLTDWGDEPPQDATMRLRSLLIAGESERAIDLAKQHLPKEACDLLAQLRRYDELFELAAKRPNDGAVQLATVGAHVKLGDRAAGQAILAELAERAAAGEGQDFHHLIAEANRHWPWLRLEAFELLHQGATAGKLKGAGLLGHAISAITDDNRELKKLVAAARWPVLDAKWIETCLKEYRANGFGSAPDELTNTLAAAANELTKPAQQAQTFELAGVIALACGDRKKAGECFARANAAVPKSTATVRLGDLAAADQRWAEAAEFYGSVVEGPAAPLAMYLGGQALVRAGEGEEGRRRIALAHSLPLANAPARMALADGLEARGMYQEALAEWAVIARLNQDRSYEHTHALARLAEAARKEKKYAEAVRLRQQSAFDYLTGGIYFVNVTGYLWLAGNLAQRRAGERLAADAADAASRHLALAAEIDPWAATPVFAQFAQAGQWAAAAPIHAKVVAQLRGLLAKYPESAMLHNHLAWFLAKTRRQPAAALLHAERAVALAPLDYHYLDTKAEVIFRQGDRAGARKLFEECLRMAPFAYPYRDRQRYLPGYKGD